MARNKSEKERKIGHRRVGVGGEITYKKVIFHYEIDNVQNYKRNYILFKTIKYLNFDKPFKKFKK